MGFSSIPSLTEILVRLAQNWRICKARLKRAAQRNNGSEERDQHHEKADDDYNLHPFLAVLDRVVQLTGVDRDGLAEAIDRGFSDCQSLVEILTRAEGTPGLHKLYSDIEQQHPKIAAICGLPAPTESADRPIIWRRNPFYHVKEHLPKDDVRRTGTFSTNPIILEQLGQPIVLPSVTPDKSELEILALYYPDGDSRNPPWDDIKARLMAGGISLDTVHNSSSRDLVRILPHISRNQKETLARVVPEADPEVLAELAHIRTLGVNEQQAATLAFRTNQRSRREERERTRPSDNILAVEQPPQLEKPMENNKVIDIFISHSSRDAELAKELIDLFHIALNVPAKKIRCTSVSGYKLPAGADTNEQLRRETIDATAFIGLLTEVSLESAYVLFELGARWGARKYLATLIGAGGGTEILAGPLSGINAMKCERDDVVQLVNELAHQLGVQPERADAYLSRVDRLITVSLEIAEHRSTERLAEKSKETRTTPVSDFEIGYLMTMSRPRNEGFFYPGIQKQRGREAAKYQDAIEHFRLLEIVDYCDGGYRYTECGWSLCDQLWTLKILDSMAIDKLHEAEDLAVAVELTEGQTEADELKRLLLQMEEKGFVKLRHSRNALLAEIMHAGLTHRKTRPLSLVD